jgi:uncharacterized protein
MKWEQGDSSGNVEDRRGMTPAIAAGGGGLAIVVAIIAFFITGDANKAKQIANQVGGAAGGGAPVQKGEAPKDGYLEFADKVLGMTDTVWKAEFAKMEQRYEKPKMVLFSNKVTTEGCGSAPSAVGPFYCPADKTVYLDPTFFDELESKLGGSKAKFSQAYVIGHEVGHHVQNLLGYSRMADNARKKGKGEGNIASVRLELQADYLAGVWTHHADKKYQILEGGDVEAALKSANSIGDDRLQKNSQGWVSPEGFTHGTSDQRMKYFKLGLRTGDSTKKALDKFFQVQYNEKRGELVDDRI